MEMDLTLESPDLMLPSNLEKALMEAIRMSKNSQLEKYTNEVARLIELQMGLYSHPSEESDKDDFIDNNGVRVFRDTIIDL